MDGVHWAVALLSVAVVSEFAAIVGLAGVAASMRRVACDSVRRLREEGDRRVLMWTAMMILMMVLMIKDGNRDGYVQVYNRLYFYGVPKDILDDGDALNGFLNDCIEWKMNVLEGEGPYKYRFVKRRGDEEDA